MTEPIRHRPQRLRACHRIVIDKSDQGNVRVSSIHDARVRAASPEAELPRPGQRAGGRNGPVTLSLCVHGVVAQSGRLAPLLSHKTRTSHVPRQKTMSSSRKAWSAGGIYIMALIEQAACHAFPNGPAAAQQRLTQGAACSGSNRRLPRGDLGPRFPPSMGGKRRQRVRRDIEGAEMEFLASGLVGQGVLPE